MTAMTFLAIARMAFFREAFYRFELLFSALRALVFVLVISAIWHAIYLQRDSVGGFSLEQVVFYTCTAATLMLLYELHLEREIGDRLRTGNLALQLLKPVNYFLFGLAEGTGTAAYTAVFSAIPTFLFLLILFDLPTLHMESLLPAIVMVLLGFVLFFSFCHLTALTTFFTEEAWAFEYVRTTVVRFFAGGFLPLTFFPEALLRVAMWLPFPYMVYYPVLALTGRLSPELYLPTIGIQMVWCALLLLANYGYWKVILRQVFIHGG